MDDDGIFDSENFNKKSHDEEIKEIYRALRINAELMKNLEVYENDIVNAISDSEEYKVIPVLINTYILHTLI